MRLSLLVLAIIVFLSVAAPLIAPYDPMRTDPAQVMQPPTTVHLLGTDLLGRDVLSRLLFGGRQTLVIAGLATLVAVIPGLCVGLSGGLFSRRVDAVLQVFINSMLAVPALVIALVTMTLLGQGMGELALATGIAQIALFAQVTRAAALSVRSGQYVEGAKAIGANWFQIIGRHILPNISPTLFAYAGVMFSYSIINSAALGFLGLGGEPGVPEWGAILAEGRIAFRTAPWVGVAAGLMIVMTVYSVNTLVDRLSSLR